MMRFLFMNIFLNFIIYSYILNKFNSFIKIIGFLSDFKKCVIKNQENFRSVTLSLLSFSSYWVVDLDGFGLQGGQELAIRMFITSFH